MVRTAPARHSGRARRSPAVAQEMLSSLKELAAEHYVPVRDEKTKPTFAEAETLLKLQHLETTWAVASAGQLVKDREQCEELVQSTITSLSQHITREEKVLLPILSSTLARALQAAHGCILSSLAEIRAAIADVWGKAPTSGEFWPARARVQSLLRELNRFLKEHVAEEHVIFDLATMAYEKKRGRA